MIETNSERQSGKSIQVAWHDDDDDDDYVTTFFMSTASVQDWQAIESLIIFDDFLHSVQKMDPQK